MRSIPINDAVNTLVILVYLEHFDHTIGHAAQCKCSTVHNSVNAHAQGTVSFDLFNICNRFTLIEKLSYKLYNNNIVTSFCAINNKIIRNCPKQSALNAAFTCINHLLVDRSSNHQNDSAMNVDYVDVKILY